MLELNNRNFIVICVLLLLLCVGCILLSHDSSDSKTEGLIVDTKKPHVKLFHANWCPHCKTLMPIWEKVKHRMSSCVVFEDYECSNGPNEECKKYNIDAYPTIVAFTADDVNQAHPIPFPSSMEASYENLIDFVQHHSKCVVYN